MSRVLTAIIFLHSLSGNITITRILLVRLLYSYLTVVGFCVSIHSIHVPSLLPASSTATLDCVYNYTQTEKDSLEVHWYFKHNTMPFYMWTPGSLPDVVDDLFNPHIPGHVMVTNDPHTQYRAVHLTNISSPLSGEYSCR